MNASTSSRRADIGRFIISVWKPSGRGTQQPCLHSLSLYCLFPPPLDESNRRWAHTLRRACTHFVLLSSSIRLFTRRRCLLIVSRACLSFSWSCPSPTSPPTMIISSRESSSTAEFMLLPCLHRIAQSKLIFRTSLNTSCSHGCSHRHRYSDDLCEFGTRTLFETTRSGEVRY